MSVHHSLRSLTDLRDYFQARDRDRDSALALLLGRVSAQLATQNTLLERIAAQHAQILASLSLPVAADVSPAIGDLAPVDAGNVVVLADVELRSLIDLAA